MEQLEEGVVALMIEKQSAVENLEAILSVNGVDMVQFGPADYSMSTKELVMPFRNMLIMPGMRGCPKNYFLALYKIRFSFSDLEEVPSRKKHCILQPGLYYWGFLQ